MSTRKRTRQSHTADLEEDELSPSKNNTRGKEVLGTVKKRKLNTHDSSTTFSKTLNPKGRALFGKLGGLFGFGSEKGKENVQGDELDELSGDVDIDQDSEDESALRKDTDGSIGHRRSGKSRRALKDGSITTNEKDIWEVNVSEEEDESRSITRARRSVTTTPKSVTKYNEADGAADVTLKRSAGRQRREPEPGRTLHGSPDKRSMGGVRKSDILKKAKALSRDATRKEMSLRGPKSEEDQASTGKVPKRGKELHTVEAEITHPDEAESESPRVSRRRGRPRRSLEDDIAASRGIPKGILTPTKDRGIRPRKSVVFEAQQLDLGFKDIPISTIAKSPAAKNRIQQKATVEVVLETASVISDSEDDAASDEEEEEDDDDVACVICGGLDSEEPNEILFCDNCDAAYHQVCYEIPEVPEGVWYCRNCQPNADGLLAKDRNLSIKVSNNHPDIEGFEEHLRAMQRILLDKLTGQRRIKLTGHEEERNKVYQVVEQTVLAGEGNSMLVIGSRGCGKTNLIETMISDLSTEHREKFHVVRLNGFIHTDDKLALREIWRQLGREMEVDDDLATKSNAADTLASLLALLSHPSEISDNEQNHTAKSVVFVLDEFDLFTTHPRQTLLYNLFDIAQARKAPIVVLGLTTRVDVVEALEKRVKSRFSHRYVHLSLPRNIPAFWEVCQAALTSDNEELDAAGYNVNIDGSDQFISYWHSMIDNLFNRDAAFKYHLQSHFYRTKSVPGFLASCILPIASLSPESLPLTGRIFATNSISLSAPDSKLHILEGLSELELALLIAGARLDIILDTDTCNFAMAYDEYCSLTSRHKIQTSSTGLAALGASAKVWGRDVALGAWERLAAYDLLVPAGIGGGSARDFGAGGRMWKVDVGLEEITGSVDGLSGVMTKWCREI